MGIRNRIRSIFGRFDAVEASERAAIDYIVALGLFGTQMDGIPETDEEIIEQSKDKASKLSSTFNKALIPFLGTKHDSWMHEILDRFLQNYEIYRYIKELKEKMGDEEENKADHTISALTDMLVSGGKIILSLTYSNLDNKTIVISKPLMMISDNMRPLPYNPNIPFPNQQKGD